MKYFLFLIGSAWLQAAWMQLPAVPPGTTEATRVEPVPAPVEGAPQPVTGVPGAGVVGGMIAVPMGTTSGGTAGAVAATPSTGAAAPGGLPGLRSVPPSNSVGGLAGGGGAPGVAGASGRTEAAAAPVDCSARFGKSQESVAASGGTIELPVAFSAAPCAKAPRALQPWIRLAGSAAGVYRFTVDATSSSQVRDGTILLGDQRLIVRQEGGKRGMLAVSPTRVVVAVTGKKVSKPASIIVWAEDPELSYTVAPGGEKWLAVKAVKSKDPKRRRFEVELDTSGLGRGRHEAEVRIAATGVVNPPLIVPVIVEVR